MLKLFEQFGRFLGNLMIGVLVLLVVAALVFIVAMVTVAVYTALHLFAAFTVIALVLIAWFGAFCKSRIPR